METETIQLRQLLLFYVGGGWGETQPVQGHNLGAYVIRGTDIPEVRDGIVLNCPYRYHRDSNLKSRRLFPGDIVFEVSGGSKDQPVGRTVLITSKLLSKFTDDVICASFCKLLRPNPDLVDSRFLYDYLQTIYSTRAIMQWQVQSTGISNFKFEAFLDECDIGLPALGTQRKIAAVLSAYDDLIENNTRRIAILEEMAQALYREWFVHFRFPGHEEVALVEVEGMQIPEGWEIVGLGDVINFKNGKSNQSLQAGNYPVYGSNGIIGSSAKYQFEDSVIIGRVGAYCGSVLYCKTGFWASDNTIVAEAQEWAGIEWIFYTLEHMDLRQYAGGAAQPLLTQAVLKNLQTIAPSKDIHDRFQHIVKELIAQIACLTNKNTNLRQTRDLLLPRLISGEIDVSTIH